MPIPMLAALGTTGTNFAINFATNTVNYMALPAAFGLAYGAKNGFDNAIAIRCHAVVAMFGPPRSGKSTLFEKLHGQPVALNTPYEPTPSNMICGGQYEWMGMARGKPVRMAIRFGPAVDYGGDDPDAWGQNLNSKGRTAPTHLIFTYALYDGEKAALQMNEGGTFLDTGSELHLLNMSAFIKFLTPLQAIAASRNTTVRVLVLATQSDLWLNMNSTQIPNAPLCYTQAVQCLKTIELDYPNVRCLHGFANVNLLGDLLLAPLIQRFFEIR